MLATNCRVCGERLHEYLDLGDMPPANELPYSQGVEQTKYPLEVAGCHNCGMSQITTVVDPRILYADYAYQSAVSSSFRDHCKNLADSLDTLSGDSIVDIASNDGTLLEQFPDDMTRLGVEPADNLVEIARRKGIPTYPEFWSPAVANRIKDSYGRIKYITAFNVFAHVHDLHSFVVGVKSLLRKDGIFIVEVPHMMHLLQNAEFDTIYHEHLSYFLLGTLRYLFDLHGMTVVNVKESPIHGGSIRVYVKDGSEHTVSPAVHRLIAQEVDAGMYRDEPYIRLAQRACLIRQNLRETISRLEADGKVVAGFGASAKGNTLLNFAEIDLPYVVDDTPSKQGRFTSGRQIPIVSREEFDRQPPDYVLILAWNFAKEIIEKLKGMGCKFLVPIPDVRVAESVENVGWPCISYKEVADASTP